MKTILKLMIIGVIFVGCEKKTIEPIVVEVPDEVSFATEIQPHFTSKCIGCHNSSSSPASLNLTEGSSYESLISGGRVDIENPDQSEIYSVVGSSHMGVSANVEVAAYILKWIENGAQNN